MGAGPAPRSALPPLGEGGPPRWGGRARPRRGRAGRGASFLQGLGGEAARPGGKRPGPGGGKENPSGLGLFFFSRGKLACPSLAQGRVSCYNGTRKLRRREREASSWVGSIPRAGKRTCQPSRRRPRSFTRGSWTKTPTRAFPGCMAATPKRAGRPVCSGCG